MVIKPLLKFLPLVFIGIFGVQYAVGYRKYYVEDECIAPNKLQKIFYRLPSSGPDSVGELKPNRFGTYSRMGRNCLIKLVPPKGHGIIINVVNIDFRNHEGCKDYIKIYDNDDDGEKLCALQSVGQNGKTYFSDNELKILYHTSEGGMGFSNGFKIIFTVSKLDEDPGACDSPDAFKCENSRCIWAGLTCDGVNNCGDSSDERSSDSPHCPDVTPVAIAAIVLGITSFIAILVIMCLCCCRKQLEKPTKAPFLDDFPLRPSTAYTPLPGYAPLPGYSPLPGYTYGTMNSGMHDEQPTFSPTPSAPTHYTPICPTNSRNPFLQPKVEIRYDRPPPPPYRA